MNSLSSDNASGTNKEADRVQADTSGNDQNVAENTKQPSRFSIDVNYIFKTYGLAKIVQLGTSFICGLLVFLVTQQDKGKVMDLPMHWRVQALAYVALTSALFACLIFLAHCCKLTYQCPFEAHKVDLFISSVFLVAFAVLGGLVFQAAAYYDEHYPDWKGIQAYDSSLMSVVCSLTYGFGVVSLIKQIRGNDQFLSRRLYNEHDKDEQVVVVVDGWEVFLRTENPPKWTTAYEEAQAKRAKEGGKEGGTNLLDAHPGAVFIPSLY